MVVRHCAFLMPGGRQCRAAPLIDGAFCLLHDPAKAQEAGEARRLGGFRRRREGTIVVAYDLESLGTVEGIVRVLDIALRDVLGLDNSVPRNRVLMVSLKPRPGFYRSAIWRPGSPAPPRGLCGLLVGDCRPGRNALDEDLAANEWDLVARAVVEASQGRVRGLLPGAGDGPAFLEDDRFA
jgi:hypothetical protein